MFNGRVSGQRQERDCMQSVPGDGRASAGGAGSVREARIQSIARARALLDVMADGGWVSLRDLAARTGLAKTTAFNLVKALVDTGLAERNAQAGA
jgi:IclR family acetate operon transcriptional repressor